MTTTLDYYRREKTSMLAPEKTLFPGLHVVEGAGQTARDVSTKLWEMLISAETPSRIPPRPEATRSRQTQSTPEQLFDVLAAVKVMTSKVAMHLTDSWRRDL